MKAFKLKFKPHITFRDMLFMTTNYAFLKSIYSTIMIHLLCEKLNINNITGSTKINIYYSCFIQSGTRFRPDKVMT